MIGVDGRYHIDLQYQPGKINVVLDTFSMNPMVMFLTQQKKMLEEIR